MEKIRNFNNILRKRKYDPHVLNIGDPNKVWNYELIESSTFREVEDVVVKPRKSYET